MKLKEDSEDFFRNPNAAHYPKHPLNPAVQAIFTTEPDFPTSTIDIFGCSSTMGNLLRFVKGEKGKAFRMFVQVMGNTTFLVRRENSPMELIPDVRGYGHTFPESYTTWIANVKNSASHQRVLKYKLGGLGFLVRHEGDGYLKSIASENHAKPGTGELRATHADDLDSLCLQSTRRYSK